MKLYHIDAEGWQLPGKQSRGAERVEVPITAPALCAWLNARRVPLKGVEQLASVPVELTDYTPPEGAAFTFTVGPPTRDPPRVSPAFLGDLAAGAEFVPVARAAEIDRLLQRCPKCHHSADAALTLAKGEEIETILTWAAEAPTWAVAQLATRLAELAEQITERTVQ